MTDSQKQRYVKNIKNILIELASDDKLDTDFNNLDENLFLPAFKVTDEDEEIQILKKIYHYTSEVPDNILEVLRNADENDQMDDLEGVVMWEPIQGIYRVGDFCEMIGLY